MTRKRKKNKSSPGDANFQTPSKRREPRPTQTMAEALAEAIRPNLDGVQQVSGVSMYQPNPNPNYVLHQNVLQNGNAVWTPSPSPGYVHCATPTMSPPKQVDNDLLSRIINKLESMDKKLAQLDTIQTGLSNLTSRIDKMESKISNFEVKIGDVERSRDYDSKTVTNLSNQIESLESLVKKMKKYEEDQTQKETALKEELQDLKCRSMRDNLLFHKVAEEKEENCEQKVLRLMEEKLGIAGATDNIRIQRAHRIGAYNPAKTRPIVVKFAFYPDRERVRQAARQVKDGSLGVSEQFPREVMDKRRQLIPVMLKAREEGKEAYIRVDKLYINRRLYRDDA